MTFIKQVNFFSRETATFLPVFARDFCATKSCCMMITISFSNLYIFGI